MKMQNGPGDDPGAVSTYYLMKLSSPLVWGGRLSPSSVPDGEPIGIRHGRWMFRSIFY